MRLFLSLLLNALAVLCLLWLLPWTTRMFGSAVFAHGEPVEFYCIARGATVVPNFGKVSVWCQGDEETRWEYFFRGGDRDRFVKAFGDGAVFRLTARPSLENRYSGIAIENAEFSVGEEALAGRARALRAGFAALAAAVALFFAARIRNPLLAKRGKKRRRRRRAGPEEEDGTGAR